MNATTTVKPSKLNWGAAIGAGIVAGVVFIGLEMLLVWFFGGKSPWTPEHVIAAIAMGKGVLPKPTNPPDVVPVVFAVGLLIHFALALIFACILSWMISGSRGINALVIGATFGFALYFINFYLFTDVFPWFAKSRSGITIFTHVIFGLVAALTYWNLVTPRTVTR